MDRRNFLNNLLIGSLYSPFLIQSILADTKTIYQKPIPKTGEMIPTIGMGTWITFNVGGSEKLRDARAEVLRTFFKMGGGMVDSSPMYGSAEDVMGYTLQKLGYPKSLFSATKVWTSGQNKGIRQMEESEKLWGLQPFDLMQIHNLVSWEAHLETLLEWKKEGRIRYIGMTTSHGRRHKEFEQIMLKQDIDFVQFTYNVLDTEAQSRLLPIAKEKNLAVIINRPFQGGQLFEKFGRYPLPSFASEYDINNWAQFFLKFVTSHEAVTCAIPATSRVNHMKQNMGALYGTIPTQQARKEMLKYIRGL